MAHQKTAQEIVNLGVLKTATERVVHYDNFDQLPAEPAVSTFTATGTKITKTIAASITALALANKNWMLAGDGTTGCTASTGGGVDLQPSNSADDQTFLMPNTTTSASTINTVDWSSDDEIVLATKITTDSSIASTLIAVGWSVGTSIAADYAGGFAADYGTDADRVELIFNTEDTDVSATNWMATYSIGGTDYVYDLGTDWTVAISTDYEIVIALDADRFGHFYINGQHVHKTDAAMTTAIDHVPRVGIQALSTTEPDLFVRYIALSKTPTN